FGTGSRPSQSLKTARHFLRSGTANLGSKGTEHHARPELGSWAGTKARSCSAKDAAGGVWAVILGRSTRRGTTYQRGGCGVYRRASLWREINRTGDMRLSIVDISTGDNERSHSMVLAPF